MRTLVILVLVVAVCAGCVSSHEMEMIGMARSPIPVEQVKVYLAEPLNYEKVANLKAKNVAAFTYTEKSKKNEVIEQLKIDAASLGANGLILEGFRIWYPNTPAYKDPFAYHAIPPPPGKISDPPAPGQIEAKRLSSMPPAKISDMPTSWQENLRAWGIVDFRVEGKGTAIYVSDDPPAVPANTVTKSGSDASQK